MTLQDWREQMTAKGITHNDAVRMFKDAEAEIKWLNKTLAAVQELADVSVELMTHEANKVAALQEKNEQLRAAWKEERQRLEADNKRLRDALKIIAAHNPERSTALETVVIFAAMTLANEQRAFESGIDAGKRLAECGELPY